MTLVTDKDKTVPVTGGLRKCFQAFQLAVAFGPGSSRGILNPDGCLL